MLAAYGIVGLVFWPRLSVGPDGLRVHTPARRAAYGWSEVERVGLDERRRLGLSTGTLEIDARGELVVLSRWALGADPRDCPGGGRSRTRRRPRAGSPAVRR